MEEELKNIRFLIGKGPNKILKRNVPKRLRSVADKTAWIERVANIKNQELKELANMFAVKTDGELRKLNAKLQSFDQSETDSSTIADFSKTDVLHLALRYFEERLEQITKENAFFMSPNDKVFSEILAEAAEDYKLSLDAASGIISYSDGEAIKLLVKHGLVSNGDQKVKSNREELLYLSDDRNFQYLCRLIERADLELSRMRLESLQHGKMPSIDDELFSSHRRGFEKTPGIENRKTINDLIELFQSSNSQKLTKSRLSQFEIPLRILRECFGVSLALTQV